MPEETVRGRQENRSTSIIKAGDRERERWCLLLINVWSDIKEGTVNLTVKLANLWGMTIIWLRYAGNNWISHVALYAVGVPKPVHGPHRALRVVKRAVRAPHLQWTVSPPSLPANIQPPCCCFTYLPHLWLGTSCSFPHSFKATLACFARRVGGTPARLSSSC